MASSQACETLAGTLHSDTMPVFCQPIPQKTKRKDLLLPSCHLIQV